MGNARFYGFLSYYFHLDPNFRRYTESCGLDEQAISALVADFRENLEAQLESMVLYFNMYVIYFVVFSHNKRYGLLYKALTKELL